MGNNFLMKLKAQLLLLGSNPIVAWLVRQVTTCAVAYYGSAPFTPQEWQKWAVNGAVFIVSGVVHAFDVWLQQRVANAPAVVTAPSNAASVSPAMSHKDMLKAMMKMVVLLVGGLFLFASSANAGYLMSKPKSNNVSLTLPSGTAIYLMPIEGFDVGASLPNPTYGLTLNEDLVWGVQGPAAGGTNLSPIFGLGLSLYGDLAGVVNNSGPLVLRGGVNAIGPDLDLFGFGNGQGLVPQVLLSKDFVTGEVKVTGGLTVFTDLGPGTAVKVTP